MALIDDVKALIGITGTDLDGQIGLITETAARGLLARLPDLSEVPEEELEEAGGVNIPKTLALIVREVTVKRFNRSSNEGMSTASFDGEAITYEGPETDFDEFTPIISAYAAAIGGSCYGKVRFL